EVVKTSAVDKGGKKVRASPQDQFVKICHDELEALMGPVDTSLKLPMPVASVMMVGLQGSGKTTTAGKLASKLLKQGRKPLLMAELEQIKSSTQPSNILLVCDAMIGQDAVKTAAEFDRRLQLDGFILTKLDGDARGGAALSIKEVTGKPIKFLGMGEGLDKLE